MYRGRWSTHCFKPDWFFPQSELNFVLRACTSPSHLLYIFAIHSVYDVYTHPSTPRVVRGIQAAGALEVVNWNTWEFCTPYQNCVTYSIVSFSHWTASWDIEQPLGQASNLDILKKKQKVSKNHNSRKKLKVSNRKIQYRGVTLFGPHLWQAEANT